MKKIFRVYRVGGWYYYLGFILLGLIFKEYSVSIDAVKYLLLGSSLLAYAYSLNDYYDENQTKKYFIYPLILSLLLLSIFNVYQIIVSLLFLVIFTMYSSKPFRFKSLPILSSLLNGFGFISLFFLGYFHTFTISLLGILFAALLFLLELIAQFIHEVVDLEKDKREGIKTTAVVIGVDNIKKLSIILLMISILVAFFVHNVSESRANISFSVSTLLFSLYFISYISKKDITLSLRRQYKSFGMILGIFWTLMFFISP